MDRKLAGAVLIGLGAVLAAISLLADVIGIGGGGHFGLKQILGTAAGILAVAAGLWLVRSTSTSRSP
jgi:hypothetical protein